MMDFSREFIKELTSNRRVETASFPVEYRCGPMNNIDRYCRIKHLHIMANTTNRP